MRRALIATCLLALLAIAAAAMLNVRRTADGETTQANASPGELRAKGAYLALAGNCRGCHTVRGGRPYAGGLRISTPYGTFVTPNITPDPETGIGKWTAQDFRRALHEGIAPDGRPYYPAFPYTEYTKVTAADADAIFAYLRTLAPVSQVNEANRLDFPYDMRLMLHAWRALYFKSGSYQPDKTASAVWNRGAYLVEGLGHCNTCHASRNALGAMRGEALSGGKIEGLNWYAPSLTAAGEAGTRDWPVEDTVRMLRTGVSTRGVTSGPMAEVVQQSLQYLSDGDLHAMAVYLNSLPATPGLPNEAVAESTQEARNALVRGSRLYERNCANCHGAAGEGAPGAYPPLAGNRGVTMASSLNAIRSVLDGGYAPATAGNPRPYGMPPFAQTLSDEEVALVLSYVRNAWGNRGGRVTAEQVGRNRGGTD